MSHSLVKDKMKRYTNILILLLLTGLFIPAGAQNNPYKIDDSLYPFFQRATKSRTYPQGLLIADTLYAEATKKKDKKAQCLALTIPVSFYYSSGNYEKLEQAATKLKEEARKNNYLQYYYSAYTSEINWLLNNGHSLRALHKAEEMKEQAFKDQHNYGIFSCIRTLGHIYYMRQNSEVAAEYYKNALEYMLKHLPEQDPSYLYMNLAEYYRKKDEGEVALEYNEKAVKTAKTNESRVASLMDKCQTLYSMDRIDDFNTCYEECLQLVEQYGVIRKSALLRLRICKLVLDKKYDQAYIAADSIGSPLQVYQILHVLYLKSGDYEKAYTYNKLIHKHQDSINRLVQSTDIAELNAQIGNERMKLDAKALEYKNAALNLRNTQLELERTKSQSELEKINAENSKLVLKNRNLELARLNVEAEKQKAILKEQQSASQHYIVTLSLVLSFLFLFTCFLIFYLYRRRRTMAILQEKNEELTVARDHAEESDRMKSFFIQNMSHEIRTPLNAIVGFSNLLATTEDEEKKQKFINIIENNNQLLLQLIGDILDLAKVEANTLEFIYKPTNLNELVRGIEETMRTKVQQGVVLNYTLGMADCCIETEPNRLSQVLINLLTNACKFTSKGSITFGYEVQDNEICFFVRDTGCGISKEGQARIFQRFTKLNSFAQGTGLGLSISKSIIEKMKGRIGVESKGEGKGSTFWFTVPYLPATIQKEVEVIEEPKEAIEQNKVTLLVAEDNESNYMLFESILGSHYKLIHAWDGIEAVELFDKHNPQLIIMDINMPKMDGYEATREIRKKSTTVPIIAVTAYAFASDKERIMENGFNSYVSKPINAKKLNEELKSALGSHFIFL